MPLCCGKGGLIRGVWRRFSVNKPRPTTPLDAIKFICKDLWILVFRKQIDNLKTNHRGIFVLTDNKFQQLSRMSVDRRTGIKGAEEALARAQTVCLPHHSEGRDTNYHFSTFTSLVE